MKHRPWQLIRLLATGLRVGEGHAQRLSADSLARVGNRGRSCGPETGKFVNNLG